MAFCCTIHPPALKKGQASVEYRLHQAEVHRGTLRLVTEQLLIQGRTECRENTKNDQVPKSSNSSAPIPRQILAGVVSRQDWSLEGEAVGREPPKQPALGDPTGQRETDPHLSTPAVPVVFCLLVGPVQQREHKAGPTREAPRPAGPGGGCMQLYL